MAGRTLRRCLRYGSMAGCISALDSTSKGPQPDTQPELHLDHPGPPHIGQRLDVVVEGRAERDTDRSTLERLAELWQWKMGWPYDVVEGGFRRPPEGPQLETADADGSSRCSPCGVEGAVVGTW
jgi:hypothetical protein